MDFGKDGNIITIIIFLLFIAITLTLVGCDKDIHNHPHLVTGKQLFEHHCATCHRETGTGDFLKGVRANKDTKLSMRQIAHKVRKSESEKRKMPLFPMMSTEEVALIANYVKRL